MEDKNDKYDNFFEFEFNTFLYSYIGIEFENICINFIHNAFDSCRISIRKRYYYGEIDQESYIVPDVLIFDLTKDISKKLNISKNKTIVMDFKRSITAVSLKDINYLNFIENSILILCIFQNNGKELWLKKIEKIINESKISQGRKEDILKNIHLWSATNEFAKLLQKNERENFFSKLNLLENLKTIAAIRELNSNLIEEIKNQNVPYLSNKVHLLEQKVDQLQMTKYLIVLRKISSINLFILDDIIQETTFSQPVIEEILKEFLDLQIISKKVFSPFLPHFYYTLPKKEPNLINYFEQTDQKEQAEGLKLLIKRRSIPNEIIEEFHIDEFKDYLGIDKKYSIRSILKLYGYFEKNITLTPSEAATKLNINQNIITELLRIMVSIEILKSFKLEWETSIKFYTLPEYNQPKLKDIRKYLPDLINKSLDYFKKTTSLKIIDTNDLKNLFGSNWFSILQVFGVLVKYNLEYRYGYSPESLMELIRIENMNHSFIKVRKMLARLSKTELDLLAIKRENEGTVGKIRYYYLKNQNNQLYLIEKEVMEKKINQLEKAIESIRIRKNLTKNEIKTVLKDGWTSKLRIYYILKAKEKLSDKELTVTQAMTIVPNEGIKISKTNFIRYLSPFSREPFNLIEIKRTKKGENSPISKIKLL